MTPSERFQWINAIINRLFAADIRKLNILITDLNRKNQVAWRDADLRGFISGSVTYVDTTMSTPVVGNTRVRFKPVHESLKEEEVAFIESVEPLGSDRNDIKQIITLLLGQVMSRQEIRDCLPDCVVHLVPELNDLERKIQDCTYQVRSDKYAMKFIEKTMPKLEAYSVMSLMI